MSYIVSDTSFVILILWLTHYHALDLDKSYALTPVYEAATRSVSEEQPSTPVAKPDHEDANTKDVALPGVNLIFDGAELHPFDIVACLQARQPLSLISEASAASLAIK